MKHYRLVRADAKGFDHFNEVFVGNANRQGQYEKKRQKHKHRDDSLRVVTAGFTHHPVVLLS